MRCTPAQARSIVLHGLLSTSLAIVLGRELARLAVSLAIDWFVGSVDEERVEVSHSTPDDLQDPRLCLRAQCPVSVTLDSTQRRVLLDSGQISLELGAH